MAIPIVETTAISNQTSNASSKTDVTSPSGVLADDIVLIFIAMDGDAANPEADADGFATLTSFPEGADEIYVLWKRSTGSEPANYTVNWTGNEQARFMTVRVSGCITSGDPWDVISSGVSNSASTTNVISRLTSTVVDTLALYAVAVDRDRVDAADTITGTGWTEVGLSGSSGGANGVGLIVGENDMPTAVQVEAGTFGTWASDQNASRGFNLKPPTDLDDQLKTFDIDALVQAQDQTKTFDIDVFVQQQDNLKTFDVDAIIKAEDTLKTFDIDAILKAFDTLKTFDIDALASVIDTLKTFDIDAIIKALDSIKTFSIDAIVHEHSSIPWDLESGSTHWELETGVGDWELEGGLVDQLKTFDIDALVKAQDTLKTFDIDAIVKALDTLKTFDIDVIAKALDLEKTFDIDALVQAIDNLKTFDIDTLVQSVDNLKTFDIDAIMKALDLLKTFDIDAIVKAFDQTKTFDIDAILTTDLDDQTKTFTIDAIVKALDSLKTFDIDTFVQSLDNLKTFDIDTIVKALDLEKTFDVDVLLQSVDNLKTFDIDVFAQSIDNLKTFDIDARLVLAQTKQFTIDAQVKGFDQTKAFTMDAILIIPGAPPVVTRRPKLPVPPLQPLAPEITEERLTVILMISLFKKEIASQQIATQTQVSLYQRESITTKLRDPERWLAKDHIISKIKLVLTEKERYSTKIYIKLRSHIQPKLLQQDADIEQLRQENAKLTKLVKTLQTSLVKLSKNTMSAEDVIALFSATD